MIQSISKTIAYTSNQWGKDGENPDRAADVTVGGDSISEPSLSEQRKERENMNEPLNIQLLTREMYEKHFTELTQDKENHIETRSAVHSNYKDMVALKHQKIVKEVEKKGFVLPVPAVSNAYLYSYLNQERVISRVVIDFFVKQDLIYESRDYHNIVFKRQEYVKAVPEKKIAREPFEGEDTITNRILHWKYSGEQVAELKKAIAAKMPKASILEYFYPETSVEQMIQIRETFEALENLK